jgi:hypothetical protein
MAQVGAFLEKTASIRNLLKKRLQLEPLQFKNKNGSKINGSKSHFFL